MPCRFSLEKSQGKNSADCSQFRLHLVLFPLTTQLFSLLLWQPENVATSNSGEPASSETHLIRGRKLSRKNILFISKRNWLVTENNKVTEVKVSENVLTEDLKLKHIIKFVLNRRKNEQHKKHAE